MKSSFGRLSKALTWITLPVLVLVFSGCSQEFGVALNKLDNLPEYCLKENGDVVPATDGDCSLGPSGPALSKKTLEFGAGSIQNKLIDVVMVIDNSGSMSEEQQKVKDGLANVASEYLSHFNYTNDSLDVCVHVISSSHYLDGPNGEGFVGCTSNSAINLPNLVNNAVAGLGTGGRGAEALGKSLVTYLSGKSNFASVLSSSSLTRRADFRQNATLALVLVTDENNYKAYSSSGLGAAETLEAYSSFNVANTNSSENQTWLDNGEWNFDKNDIPNVTNKMSRKSALAADLNALVADSRKGIKNYIQDLGFNLSKLTTLNFLKSTLVNSQLAPAPLLSNPLSMGDKNLFELRSIIGNGSINSDIDGDTNYYTSQFQQLFSNSVSIQSQFPLSPAAATSVGLVVKRVRAGQETILSSGSYSLVQSGSALQLTQQAASQIQSGDIIRITYFY